MRKALSIMQINRLLCHSDSDTQSTDSCTRKRYQTNSAKLISNDPNITNYQPQDIAKSDLIKMREVQITEITGNIDSRPYDVDIAAQAQSLGMTYNGAVRVANKARALLASVSGAPVILQQSVHQLPWETVQASLLIDRFMNTTGLSFAAAVVVVMQIEPWDNSHVETCLETKPEIPPNNSMALSQEISPETTSNTAPVKAIELLSGCLSDGNGLGHTNSNDWAAGYEMLEAASHEEIRLWRA